MISITTVRGDIVETPPQNQNYVYIQGNNIVSVGVQTNNLQADLNIEQFFVQQNGDQAFIQVYNANSSQAIGWWWWAVIATDDSASASLSKPTATVEGPQPVKKSE